MTKIVNLNGKSSKVSKELISAFGEGIYHSEGVHSVRIHINFKDGTTLGFSRSENEDDIKRFVSEED